MKTFLILCFLVPLNSFALSIKEIARFEMPEKSEFQATRVGGISGIVYNEKTDSYFAVSDDRGKYGGPRMYEFSLKLLSSFDSKMESKLNSDTDKKKSSQKSEVKFEIAVKNMFLINEDFVPSGTGHGELSEEEKAKQIKVPSKARKLTSNILDLEGIAPLPWGGFVVSSEGDFGKRPRVMPRLMEVKADGTFVRDFELPPEYIPELTGKQTQGMMNNQAIEGLTTLPSKDFIAAVEGPLYQDPETQTRWIRYEMVDAWVFKPIVEYIYPLETLEGVGQKGISEIFALNDDQIVVIERDLSVSNNGFGYHCFFYLVDLREKTPLDKSARAKSGKKPFKADLIRERFRLTKKKIGEMSGPSLNLEGIARGPTINGQNTLLLVVDNNFTKSVTTEFILVAIEDLEKK